MALGEADLLLEAERRTTVEVATGTGEAPRLPRNGGVFGDLAPVLEEFGCFPGDLSLRGVPVFVGVCARVPACRPGLFFMPLVFGVPFFGLRADTLSTLRVLPFARIVFFLGNITRKNFGRTYVSRFAAAVAGALRA